MKNSNKKKLSVFILLIKTSEPKAKNINIAMIDTDVYCVTYCLKKAQVFVVFMRDI